ncbi:MAG TPA: MSMEG_4193 family putative phosphomutase [Intrasporangium sp.]|uniref:MSMEG_4193 family putative phosphomutase n=1 Tax=Intrasporangium sp. TaxID=1925024 RepID=UPI002D76829A|nr:MSMEG_4193 family putative phosphomutase [Intrasporangium sp.]HET7396879.1 MSMEG_4193 family putative phosphomutase [Intrasporangium sp.]
MPTVLLVRHGRSSANSSGTLAGWTPGVFLDAAGEQQADALGARLAAAEVPVAEIVSSPLDRCVQTADRLASALGGPVTRSVHDGLAECRYGAWTGRPLAELAKEELWKVVQERPSQARFPDSPAYEGESLTAMWDRALDAVREVNERVTAEHGADAVWVAVSHGDVIKAVLADAAGSRLDDFQRLHVDPASLSVVHYTSRGPFVVRLNDVGGDLSGLRPTARATQDGELPEGDAVVGGGPGTSDRVGP